jgi:hypothetical protein
LEEEMKNRENHFLSVIYIALVFLCVIAGVGRSELPPEPINKWVLKTRAPNHIHENDMAYDPNTGRAVFTGGHVGKLYPQNNYTFLYDVRRNRFFESQSLYRPQRRCFVNLAYVDSCRMIINGCGSPGHGSLPQGGFSKEQNNYKECYRAFNVGPWVYDAIEDS